MSSQQGMYTVSLRKQVHSGNTIELFLFCHTRLLTLWWLHSGVHDSHRVVNLLGCTPVNHDGGVIHWAGVLHFHVLCEHLQDL